MTIYLISGTCVYYIDWLGLKLSENEYNILMKLGGRGI